MREQATWFWTKEIKNDVVEPLLGNLLQTQNVFREILETNSARDVIDCLLNHDKLTPELATLHLMRASDFSAELLDRTRAFIQYTGLKTLRINIKGQDPFTYTLREIASPEVKQIKTDTITSAEKGLLYDINTILLFGANIEEFSSFVSFKKLYMGRIVGDKARLGDYLMLHYLIVSRQTQGRQNVDAGTRIQKFVRERIMEFFRNKSYLGFVDGNRIPGMGYANGLEMDLVYRINSGKKPVFI